MAGHSHWHNIKHQKASADKKKAAVIAKMGVLITIAVQVGGGPKPEDNPRLRLAMLKARAAEMSNEAVERAIKKAAGELGSKNALSEVTYEGYGPGGIAIVAQALTDNRNRTAPEIKKIFEVHGGAVGAPGCVAWQFKARSVFLVERTTEDAVMEALLAANADASDIAAAEDGAVSVIGEPKDYDAILKALAAAKLTVSRSDLTQLADTQVPATGAVAEQVQKLLDALDDHSDVQGVYHNMVV